jgi:hypothetical protein
MKAHRVVRELMLAWSFSARTVDEVSVLLRALGKHRYLRTADHALHWSVDEALSFLPPFADRAAAFRDRLRRERALDVGSRDPSLWRAADVELVSAALSVFWTPGPDADRAAENLEDVLSSAEIELSAHAPFQSDPEDPPHPELIWLDWELFPIDELSVERHAGAIRALQLSGEEVDVSAPVYQEATALAFSELVLGAPRGVLPDDFSIWSDGAYSYVDYVFRGVAKAAKLVDPPIGLHDF